MRGLGTGICLKALGLGGRRAFKWMATVARTGWTGRFWMP